MKRLITIVMMVLVTMWFTTAFARGPGHGGGNGYGGGLKYLNPRGLPSNVEVQGLAPRLETIVGKTIYVVVCEAGPQTGPVLFNYLQQNYPDTNWKHIQYDGFGPSAPDQEVKDNADAVIGGQSW